jgi:hypothetical protein
LLWWFRDECGISDGKKSSSEQLQKQPNKVRIGASKTAASFGGKNTPGDPIGLLKILADEQNDYSQTAIGGTAAGCEQFHLQP